MATKGTDARVIISQYDLSTDINDSNVNQDVGLEDVTTYGQSAHTFAVTLKNGAIDFSGIFSAVAGESDPVLAAALGSANGEPVSYFPGGYGANGNAAKLAATRTQNYKLGAPVAGIVKFTYACQADGGVDNGVVLHLLQAETTATNTTAVDNLALTSNGGVGNLHVTAFDGTDITIKVQHAAVSTYADLLTFGVVSAVGSERAVVAPSTTVNRNLRVLWTGTFTSCTFVVSFARR